MRTEQINQYDGFSKRNKEDGHCESLMKIQVAYIPTTHGRVGETNLGVEVSA